MAYLSIKRYWREELVFMGAVRMKLATAETTLKRLGAEMGQEAPILDGEYCIEIQSDRNWDLISDPVTVSAIRATALAQFFNIDPALLGNGTADARWAELRRRATESEADHE